MPAGHPLRLILAVADAAFATLPADFQQLYALSGRRSIAPEKLLRALLLQAFYSVRSERQLMEQLDYNLLLRWFVGLAVDEPVWDVTVFTKNRDRLLDGAIAAKFLRAVLAQPKVEAFLSDEHFSVDGTLIQAPPAAKPPAAAQTDRSLCDRWASMKSFRPKDGSGEPPAPGRNGERDFYGEQPTNDTHASATDPEARLFRNGKGKEAKLSFMGHALMENRHGLLVDGRVSEATGTAERDMAATMLAAVPGRHPITVGGDKGFDTAGFVAALRPLKVTPHAAQNISNRRSAIDGRTTRHPGYAVSQRIRKRSKRRSGGSRRSPCSDGPGTAARSGSAGSSPWRPRPTT